MKKKGRSSAMVVCFFVISCVLVPASAQQSPEKRDAHQILNATGVKGGLIAHVGCGDGKLTAALRANDRYLVHGLDADAQNVEEARQYIRSVGLHGNVSVETLAGRRLPYTDNLVNLVVSENLGEVPTREVMRVLRPNGVAYIKKGQRWVKRVKPWPKEIDEWTHFLHGPDNNAVAQDTVVGPPHHIQWVGGPEWARSHDHLASVSALVSSGGRIFYIVDEGPIASVALPAQWFLVARDAFNGVVLWKRPIGPWEGHLRGFRSGPAALARRLVAVNDQVYVTLGYGKPLSALDAATGQTVKTYEGTGNALEIIYCDGTLFLVVGDTASDTSEAPGPAKTIGQWSWWPIYETTAPKERILAVEPDTGNILWQKSDSDTAEMMPTTLAVDGGRVVFQSPTELICLEAKSGQEIWRAARPISLSRLGWSTPTLVLHGDVVLSADRAVTAQDQNEPAGPRNIQWVVNSKGGDAPVGELIAFSAKTGEKLWSCACRETYNAPVDVFVAGELVWSGDLVRSRDPGLTVGRDLITGEVRMQRPRDSEVFTVGMGHHRCYRNKATDRYLLLGRAGVEFVELASGKTIPNHWVRGTCQYGIMPCNGLLYAPPHSCACYIRAKLNGFCALAPERKPERARRDVEGRERLQRGPAYGRIAAASSSVEPDDWPTYRHDSARSGYTKSVVPAALKPIWQADVGGRLTSPTAAGQRIFVASVETHTVYALDASSGETLWMYTAGGRVDSPPTINKGLVLFGSADGWVYCLSVSDGELVWRFRAAPQERRVVAYGQLESVWPVHGSVLVQDDIAYCAAGRSSYLDGGIYLYRLDPKTGKKLSETRVNSRDPETGQEPQATIRGTDMPGALPDVLSSDGTSVYMRHLRFDQDGGQQEQNVTHLYSPAGFLDDSWWHRTYWLVGTKMASGYGGWPNVGNVVPSGRLLVFDASDIYGFGRDQYGTHGSHVGLGKTRFRLFAASRKPLPEEKTPMKDEREKRAKRQAPRSTVDYHWSEASPLVARAMVLADRTLFLAGPIDQVDNPLGALDPGAHAALWVVSTGDGKKLAEYKLASLPVFDGMIAANKRLYISTRDGRVICMGNNELTEKEPSR